MVSRRGLGSLRRWFFGMSFQSSFSTLLGLLLLFWEALLPLRYCAGRFAGRIPTWRLPVGWHVIGLVTHESGGDAVVLDGHCAPVPVPGLRGDAGVDWVSGPGGGVKRVRLNRKTPAFLVRHGIWGIQSRPRVWKRLRTREHPGFGPPDAKGWRVHQSGEGSAPDLDREGIGWGHAQAHVSRP